MNDHLKQEYKLVLEKFIELNKIVSDFKLKELFRRMELYSNGLEIWYHSIKKSKRNRLNELLNVSYNDTINGFGFSDNDKEKILNWANSKINEYEELKIKIQAYRILTNSIYGKSSL